MSKTAKHESDPLVQDAIQYGGWTVVADKAGKKYYQNKNLKKSTWDLKKDIEGGTYPKYAPDNGATPASAADKVQEAMNQHHSSGATVLGSTGIVPPTGTGSFSSSGQDKRIATLMQANTDMQNEIESLKLEQDAIAIAISEANQKVQVLNNKDKDEVLTAKVVPTFSAEGNEKLLAQANETRMENWHIFSQLSELVTLLGQGLQETAASRAEVGTTLTNETRALQMPEGVADPSEEAKNDEAESEQTEEKDAYGSELKGEAGAGVINRFLDTAGKYQVSPNSLSELLKYRDVDLLGKDQAENPFGSVSSTVSNPYPTGEGATGALERAIAASKQKHQLGITGSSYVGGNSPNIAKATPWGVAQGNHAADGYRTDSPPTAAPFY